MFWIFRSVLWKENSELDTNNQFVISLCTFVKSQTPSDMEVDNVQVQTLKNEHFAIEDSKEKKLDNENTLKVSYLKYFFWANHIGT